MTAVSSHTTSIPATAMAGRVDQWFMCLLEIPAPLEAVLGTEDAAHAEPVIFRGAAWIAADDHVIARLERVVRDAVQLPGGGPLDRPALHLPLRVRRLHVDEGMRVPEHERHHLALDL